MTTPSESVAQASSPCNKFVAQASSLGSKRAKPPLRAESTNSPPEPSGTGFLPVNPWTHKNAVAKRRNLPHLQVEEATYFVTYRCVERFELTAAARTAALSATTYWHGDRVFVDSAVVMPNHVHAILRVLDRSSLGQILHSIKSYSAKEINRLLSRSGSVWQGESFDHIIRDEAEWIEKTEYVRLNPVEARIVDRPDLYPWFWQPHRLPACATKT